MYSIKQLINKEEWLCLEVTRYELENEQEREHLKLAQEMNKPDEIKAFAQRIAENDEKIIRATQRVKAQREEIRKALYL